MIAEGFTKNSISCPLTLLEFSADVRKFPSRILLFSLRFLKYTLLEVMFQMSLINHCKKAISDFSEEAVFDLGKQKRKAMKGGGSLEGRRRKIKWRLRESKFHI